MKNNNGNKKHSKVYESFGTVIKYNGQNSAITIDGKEVKRENKVWYTEYEDRTPVNGRFIMCAPYDNFFVYVDPMWTKIPGRWFAMCSCGSIAVIVGYNAYRQDSSPSSEGTTPGEMLVCYTHASTGKHAEGST